MSAVPTTLSAVIQRQLTRTGTVNLNDKANECERRRELESTQIENLKNVLAKRNIITAELTHLDISRCRLEPVWNGVIDLKDKGTDPSKLMTKPSIAWTCQPYECHLEADLPVPWAKRHEFKKELGFFDVNCAVTETHIHEDAIAPEAHVHIICKGIVPSELARTVNRLARKTMRYRGHDIKDAAWEE